MNRELRIALFVWLGLLALLGLTVAVTFAPLGGLRAPASLIIAGVKSGLVVWFFMHLREQGSLVRVFALAALVWLGLLLLLSGTDFVSRGWLAGAP